MEKAMHFRRPPPPHSHNNTRPQSRFDPLAVAYQYPNSRQHLEPPFTYAPTQPWGGRGLVVSCRQQLTVGRRRGAANHLPRPMPFRNNN